MSDDANPRASAALAVQRVVHRGWQLPSTLERMLDGQSAENRRLINEMASGTVRWYWLLEHLLSTLLERPLRRKDQDLQCLLYVGLYQLEFMHKPQYATVSETVDATGALGKFWARGLVNAVLRKFLRIRAELDFEKFSDVCRFSHPGWMIKAIKRDWPECWQSILAANNQKPGMTLRVNINRTSVEEYLHVLQNAGIDANADTASPVAVKLCERTSVDRLPGFHEGIVSVQSTASQLAALSLDLAPGQRVLDACSAPGGKLLHIQEIAPELDEVVAVDIDKARAGQIVDNLTRAGQSATLVVADASDPDDWWDGRRFDRILIDAPCSALGVVSKHPDIKHHRKPADIDRVVEVQGKLLNALLPLLNRNGKLLYTTCSILARENDSQIGKLLHDHSEFTCEHLPSAIGQPTKYGRQRLQGKAGSDGFYYASITRR